MLVLILPGASQPERCRTIDERRRERTVGRGLRSQLRTKQERQQYTVNKTEGEILTQWLNERTQDEGVSRRDLRALLVLTCDAVEVVAGGAGAGAGAAENPARSTAGRAAAKRADETGERCTLHNAVRPDGRFFCRRRVQCFSTLSVRGGQAGQW